jgi:superfamily II DNA or RNA helicase
MSDTFTLYNKRDAWYIMESTTWNGEIKHGTSHHIPMRKDPFFTCTPRPVKYRSVFFIDISVLQARGITLAVFDSAEFPRWLKANNLWNTHVEAGGGTEFYNHADPVDIIRKFLSDMKVPILEELHEDIFPYPSQRESAGEIDAEIAERDTVRKKYLAIAHHEAILRTRFLNTFLPNKDMRRIQVELWNEWQRILSLESKYRGIIQWPTGTGKTFGMLILILLAFERAKAKGEIYRGLLIAPKNDILDTLMNHIEKLGVFGITILKGHNANFANLIIPTDKPILITTTHASLTDEASMNRLPPITHVHYDEVHRITGDEFFTLLVTKIETWNTRWVTGTSATPKTSNRNQHLKLSQLFGDPLSILHRCDVDTAVTEGWIASPRFFINSISNGTTEQNIIATVTQARKMMEKRQENGMCRGGKGIVYFNTLSEVRAAYTIAASVFPIGWYRYYAVENGDEEAYDDAFLAAPADGTPRIMFACEKYREGSDIYGLEFTAVLMGREISAYILVQIVGRALRADYAGKEGWCCILRPTFDDEDTSALAHVLFDLEAIISFNAGKTTPTPITQFVRTYFGEIVDNGRVLDLQETIDYVQSYYLRKQYDMRDRKERYDIIRNLNKDMGITSQMMYLECKSDHQRFIENPKSYFNAYWVSWYHFLGVDTSAFPPTKADFHRICAERSIRSWSEYCEKKDASLPENPGEMYEDWSNPDLEFGTEEEIVW